MDDYRLQRVRSGRQQYGRRPAIRRHRHRRVPAFTDMERWRERHLLSGGRGSTAMRLKQFIAPLTLSAVLAGIACSDLLNEDPQGFATTAAFYKTGANLNSATLATYSALRGLQGQSNWTTLDLASDQARADNREPNAGTYGPDRLAWHASTRRTDQYWATMYSAISRANLVLSKAPGVATGNEPMRPYNLPEAKFLPGTPMPCLSN